MFGGLTPERPVSQPMLPPLESPYLVNSSSRSISYLKSPSPTERVQLYQLQEQLKTLQDEILRKDKLIDQMSKLELKSCPDRYVESKLPPSRSMCVEREDIAALHVKLTDLRSQLCEATNEIQQKDSITDSLKQINGKLREEVARLHVTVESSTKEIDEYSDAKDAFETLRQRNNIMISSLQNELTETQQHLMDNRVTVKQLEDQLAIVTTEKDEYRTQIQEFKESIREITSEDIHSLLGIVQKVKTLLFERETTNNRILALEEKLKSRECEQQASRQTITRLVAKLSLEENKTANNEKDIVSLQRELDQYMASKTLIESDIKNFECQIVSLRKENEILLQDNATKSRRIEDITASSKIYQQNDEQQHQITQFINSLISVLSVNYKTPKNNSLSIFEWIIGCVKSLIQSKEDVTNMHDTIDSLKSELVGMEKVNSSNSLESDSHLKIKVEDLEMRLRNAEKEIINNAVTIDGLNCDKTKYLRILSELARVMNMNEINRDLGFDMISEALYARAIQLQKAECEMKKDQRSAEHALNRRVKELKEKLNSKDLHIDLLHKKLAFHEGKQYNIDVVGKERDKELLCNKKLIKHNQKLQKELDDTRQEVIDLKATIVEHGRLHIKAIAQDQEIKILSAKLDQLEIVRQKQSKIINDYKSNQNSKDQELQNAQITCDASIASLNHELKMVKESLNDSKRKEQQMVEMRAVVAKLLGLDIEDLAIPDFEIINRLERLIAAHQSNVYTQYSIESTLHDMNQGLFHDPCILHTHHSHIMNEDPIYAKSKAHH